MYVCMYVFFLLEWLVGAFWPVCELGFSPQGGRSLLRRSPVRSSQPPCHRQSGFPLLFVPGCLWLWLWVALRQVDSLWLAFSLLPVGWVSWPVQERVHLLSR